MAESISGGSFLGEIANEIGEVLINNPQLKSSMISHTEKVIQEAEKYRQYLRTEWQKAKEAGLTQQDENIDEEKWFWWTAYLNDWGMGKSVYFAGNESKDVQFYIKGKSKPDPLNYLSSMIWGSAGGDYNGLALLDYQFVLLAIIHDAQSWRAGRKKVYFNAREKETLSDRLCPAAWDDLERRQNKYEFGEVKQTIKIALRTIKASVERGARNSGDDNTTISEPDDEIIREELEKAFNVFLHKKHFSEKVISQMIDIDKPSADIALIDSKGSRVMALVEFSTKSQSLDGLKKIGHEYFLGISSSDNIEYYIVEMGGMDFPEQFKIFLLSKEEGAKPISMANFPTYEKLINRSKAKSGDDTQREITNDITKKDLEFIAELSSRAYKNNTLKSNSTEEERETLKNVKSKLKAIADTFKEKLDNSYGKFEVSVTTGNPITFGRNKLGRLWSGIFKGAENKQYSAQISFVINPVNTSLDVGFYFGKAASRDLDKQKRQHLESKLKDIGISLSNEIINEPKLNEKFNSLFDHGFQAFSNGSTVSSAKWLAIIAKDPKDSQITYSVYPNDEGLVEFKTLERYVLMLACLMGPVPSLDNKWIRDAESETEGPEETFDSVMVSGDKSESSTVISDVIGDIATIRVEGIGDKDRLGREKLVKTLAGLFEKTECDNGFTMALLGDWGQGKSTVMQLLENELEKKHKGKFEFAKYNAWEYENTDNIAAGIAQEVVKGLTGKIDRLKKFALRFKFAWEERREKIYWLIAKVYLF